MLCMYVSSRVNHGTSLTRALAVVDKFALMHLPHPLLMSYQYIGI